MVSIRTTEEYNRMRRLKNWLKSYTEYTSASEAPDAFHFWTGIFTIAAALQRKVWIEERVFQWTPNFYIIFVGPPGVVTKSTTIRMGVRLLNDVEGVVFGPNSLTWQALAEALENAQVAVPEDPDNVDSPLIHMAAISCVASELGTFLDADDRKMVDVFVDLWDGQVGEWKHSTKTQGHVAIQNPWLNVIGATTPSWLKENFPESMIGGGLTSRIIFIYGDKKRSLVAYPSLSQTQARFEELEEDLIHDLQEMSLIMGEYEIEKKARAYGIEWYDKHWSERPDHLSSERYEGYIARKQTHMHKLAIVIAASQRDERIITIEDLQRAGGIITKIEKDMIKVFNSIGGTQENKNLHTLIHYLLLSKKTLKLNELYIRVGAIMTIQDFNDALTAGTRSNYIKQRSDGKEVFIDLITVPDAYTSSQFSE